MQIFSIKNWQQNVLWYANDREKYQWERRTGKYCNITFLKLYVHLMPVAVIVVVLYNKYYGDMSFLSIRSESKHYCPPEIIYLLFEKVR